MKMNIKIYSTPNCPYCKMAKEFFKKNNIEFEDFNVAENLQKANEMIYKTRQTAVPVIEINNQLIIGFDENKLKKLLKIETDNLRT